jgi:hypothetical protein
LSEPFHLGKLHTLNFDLSVLQTKAKALIELVNQNEKKLNNNNKQLDIIFYNKFAIK